MQTDKEQKIELRSEEVQEVMGQIPSWILRWGITLVGIIMIGLAIGCYFFKYPDTLIAEVTVTTAMPPIEMYARVTGRIELLTVRHLQKVSPGDAMAVLENTADFKDVEFVENTFRLWKDKKIDNKDIYKQLQNHRLSLGDLQPSFTTFMMALNKNIHHYQEQYYPQKMDLNVKRRKERVGIEFVKSEEKAIHKQESNILRIMYLRDSALFVQNLISEEDYNQAEQAYLQSKEITMNDASNQRQLKIERLNDIETMLDLQQQYILEESDIMLSLNSATIQFENAIKEYEKTYVLRSPIAATVNMMGNWKQNHHVNAGDLLIILTHSGSPKVVGKAKLPAVGAGKVKIGQPVKVRLSNYPDDEYGYVTGKVSAISAIPDKDSNYYLEIDFPLGLHTNYDKNLPQTRQLVGAAEIIVKDKRLIENFIQPLEKFFKDNYRAP